MKQTGNDWKTPDGKEIPKKYVPTHEREYERLGQAIAEKAGALSAKIRDTKAVILELIKEALDKAPQKPQKRFAFYTFDKGFRIEYDIKEGYIRVYRATKENPSTKDYEPVHLEFNRADTSLPEDMVNELKANAEAEEKMLVATGVLPRPQNGLPLFDLDDLPATLQPPIPELPLLSADSSSESEMQPCMPNPEELSESFKSIVDEPIEQLDVIEDDDNAWRDGPLED